MSILHLGRREYLTPKLLSLSNGHRACRCRNVSHPGGLFARHLFSHLLRVKSLEGLHLRCLFSLRLLSFRLLC